MTKYASFDYQLSLIIGAQYHYTVFVILVLQCDLSKDSDIRLEELCHLITEIATFHKVTDLDPMVLIVGNHDRVNVNVKLGVDYQTPLGMVHRQTDLVSA